MHATNFSHLSSTHQSNSLLQHQPKQQNTSRYKTELCRPYEENGTCKYGEKCQFAHGMGELRTLTRHPKYKTEFCRTFHTTGFCPYGPRCHFIHNSKRPSSSSNHHQQSAMSYSDMGLPFGHRSRHSASPPTSPISSTSSSAATTNSANTLDSLSTEREFTSASRNVCQWTLHSRMNESSRWLAAMCASGLISSNNATNSSRRTWQMQA